jgi:hypothetical protein
LAEIVECRFRNVYSEYGLLSAETSCYRYWGQGIWTDYGGELSRARAKSSHTTFERVAAMTVLRIDEPAESPVVVCRTSPTN